ncbi:MAG: C-terminal helicase domain-containing protein, partial [Planctomycetota bacterium]|nr:C-terminal helicase domain-containing protein [Planctomycetota bacterium]
DVFLVFCERRTDVDRLMRKLERRRFSVKALHGGYDQAARFKVMAAFRTGDVKCLVATDVASRGLDVAHVTHVVNLGVPRDVSDYTHRIGRTGRAGRHGVAVTFVAGRDERGFTELRRASKFDLRAIERPRELFAEERRRAKDAERGEKDAGDAEERPKRRRERSRDEDAPAARGERPRRRRGRDEDDERPSSRRGREESEDSQRPRRGRDGGERGERPSRRRRERSEREDEPRRGRGRGRDDSPARPRRDREERPRREDAPTADEAPKAAPQAAPTGGFGVGLEDGATPEKTRKSGPRRRRKSEDEAPVSGTKERAERPKKDAGGENAATKPAPESAPGSGFGAGL